MTDQIYRNRHIIYHTKSIFPLKIDFRPSMPPIEDQGNLEACSPNACVSVIKYIIKRDTGRHIDISRLFIYYTARRLKKPHGVLNDHGIPLKYCIRALKQFGTCEEEYWPYREDLVNQKPPWCIYERAKQYKIVPIAIPINIKSFKTVLASGQLPMAGIYLHPSAGTEAVQNEGRIPIPDANSIFAKNSPWHSVVFVGYDDIKKHFIVRNSWSFQWGLAGYFYLPYEYFKNPGLIDVDRGAWTIQYVGIHLEDPDRVGKIYHPVYRPSPVMDLRNVQPRRSSQISRRVSNASHF